jgi:formate hydrogenlyase subunit 3/multisubunit Na+/H+ antiporter MnhD subunit
MNNNYEPLFLSKYSEILGPKSKIFPFFLLLFISFASLPPFSSFFLKYELIKVLIDNTKDFVLPFYIIILITISGFSYFRFLSMVSYSRNTKIFNLLKTEFSNSSNQSYLTILKINFLVLFLIIFCIIFFYDFLLSYCSLNSFDFVFCSIEKEKLIFDISNSNNVNCLIKFFINERLFFFDYLTKIFKYSN